MELQLNQETTQRKFEAGFVSALIASTGNNTIGKARYEREDCKRLIG